MILGLAEGRLQQVDPILLHAEHHQLERGRLIELPKLWLEPGMRVRVLQGPLHDQIGYSLLCVRTNGCWYCCDCLARTDGSRSQGM